MISVESNDFGKTWKSTVGGVAGAGWFSVGREISFPADAVCYINACPQEAG